MDGINKYSSIHFDGDYVRILDQRFLPHETRYLTCSSYIEVAAAIQQMAIRGAPAIGAAAAYGLALVTRWSNSGTYHELLGELEEAAALLIDSRPTAVNLSWAVDRVMNRVKKSKSQDVVELAGIVLTEAEKIAQEDIHNCQLIGRYGAALIPENANIVHHCNTGGLATVAYGTALGVIRAAHELGKQVHVFVDETRPRLQGARLTAWELQQLGIPHTIVVDGASGLLMRQRRIDLCIVGCDRVASNGDVANKIGTYNLAVVARAHHVPFYVAGPLSSFDFNIPDGEAIVVEERPQEEITHIDSVHLTPENTQVYNPAFDVTPHELITAFVTEKGVIYPPFLKNLKEVSQSLDQETQES